MEREGGGRRRRKTKSGSEEAAGRSQAPERRQGETQKGQNQRGGSAKRGKKDDRPTRTTGEQKRLEHKKDAMTGSNRRPPVTSKSGRFTEDRRSTSELMALCNVYSKRDATYIR